jgi:pyridinium-3,5-biscarboxylic acid mononucleotide synthase
VRARNSDDESNDLKVLLEAVARGETPPDAALERLRALPFADLGHAKVDLHRAVRHGAPEVIFCKGKTPEQILSIVRTLVDHGQHVLATRATAEIFEHCRAAMPDLRFHPHSGVMTNLELDESSGRGLVLVVSAGTSDLPVAEEAVLTARACGSRVRFVSDVGVSGLHRLLAHTELLQQANAIVVCAGMEGALPSVVGGLVAAPVIAVPTSIGYGASFGGLAALLGMLNSCANNVTVVNIDNGFGAGYVASLINLRRQNGGDTEPQA